MSLRVAVDGRELRAGVRTGIRRYTLQVLRAAVERGLDCVLYGDGDTALEAIPSGVRPFVLDHRVTQWWDQVALPAALRRDGAEVFLSPYYKRPLAAPCPVVVTVHDLFFIGYPGRRRPLYDAALTRLARLYAAGADAIVADSEHSRRAIVARLGIPAERIAVIPVGLDAEFRPTPLSAAQRERYDLGARYALYVGNFLPHKNLPRLLRAWATLSGTEATHRLVLAGGDPARREALVALAASLGLGDRIAFAGVVDDADLPAVYTGATLLVLPSLEEGFGLPALEAMACGTPVVAGRRGALPELVGDAGWLVDPEDERELAAAVGRLLSDPVERQRLTRRGRARAAGFTTAATAGRIVDLLRATADARPVTSTRAG